MSIASIGQLSKKEATNLVEEMHKSQKRSFKSPIIFIQGEDSVSNSPNQYQEHHTPSPLINLEQIDEVNKKLRQAHF
jgi:hypothetical protein